MPRSLLDMLRIQAQDRGLLDPTAELDAATVFRLVRDMPYQRASDRRPETIIQEWRGTCSGKHYLLAALFQELGLNARVMAGVLRYRPDPATTHPQLLALLDSAGGDFVDVHNWVEIDMPTGVMIVDATWPVTLKSHGFPVNETFELGKSQKLVYPVQKVYAIPEDEDPQVFKDALLRKHFTRSELNAREAFIQALSAMLSPSKKDATQNDYPR